MGVIFGHAAASSIESMFLKTIFFLLAFTWSPLLAKAPNVLILYADDLGFGDLGCYHSESKIPTPNLDRLASEGMRFTDGHSSSGICTPSRYALLTGRHHWRDFHGIVNAFGSSVFKPERLTLPEMLQARGYHTAVIGKWHLGWDWNAIRKPDVKATEVGEGRRKKKQLGPDAFDWLSPNNLHCHHPYSHHHHFHWQLSLEWQLSL